MKILIADDDSIVRAVVQRVAAQAAFESVAVADGLAALRVIESEQPDILVTDLRMPVLDGFDLIAAIRGSSVYGQLPILCLSAVSDRDAITRLAALGVTEYLLKPIRPRELATRLQGVAARIPSADASGSDDGAAGPKATILLIDPNVESRAALSAALSPICRVLEAESGAHGLSLARLGSPRIAAVFLSERMDLLNEAQIAGLLRRLSASQDLPAPPIILMRESGDENFDNAVFDGVVHRSNDVAHVVAAMTPWLPAEAPCPAP